MKRPKTLEDMSNRDLLEAMIFDENIADNIHVSNDYAEDEYGNTMVTMGFEEPKKLGKKGGAALVVFTFNALGRMLSMEVGVRNKTAKKWQIATSEKFVDMNQGYVDIAINERASRKKGS